MENLILSVIQSTQRIQVSVEPDIQDATMEDVLNNCIENNALAQEREEEEPNLVKPKVNKPIIFLPFQHSREKKNQSFQTLLILSSSRELEKPPNPASFTFACCLTIGHQRINHLAAAAPPQSLHRQGIHAAPPINPPFLFVSSSLVTSNNPHRSTTERDHLLCAQPPPRPSTTTLPPPRRRHVADHQLSRPPCSPAPASPPSLRRRCRAPARRQSLSSSPYSWRRILFRRLLKVLKWPISLFTQGYFRRERIVGVLHLVIAITEPDQDIVGTLMGYTAETVEELLGLRKNMLVRLDFP
ncbi:uncharacterized protein [Spinacia oleracea]|uniref:Uncharacterized protein n=1 Tax=Spinacia oleracea TaxID=3562 RepID=A0ABM3QZZ2_SPIOL|nr:uncharacterized protein LOC130463720 [Spinacia oleracea]